MTEKTGGIELATLGDIKTEDGFILMGDPGDKEVENLVPPKQPPNLHPVRVVWDQKKHVYYILYSDMRLVKVFRHVFRRDIEDSLIIGKLWNCDVVDLEFDENSLLFLCREWDLSKNLGSKQVSAISLDDTQSSSDTSSVLGYSPKKSFDPQLRHFVTKVDKRTLANLGQMEIPVEMYQQEGAYTKAWHMAADGSDILIYVEHSERLFHFEGGSFKQVLRSVQFHKRDEVAINEFKVRGVYLYVGTSDSVLSVYNWKEQSGLCKVIIKLPDAENGSFALLGKSLTVSISRQKIPSDDDGEDQSGRELKCNKKSGVELKNLRFVDVGTKDTFRKPINLQKFKIVTAASNGKLILYNFNTNELVYQNI